MKKNTKDIDLNVYRVSLSDCKNDILKDIWKNIECVAYGWKEAYGMYLMIYDFVYFDYTGSDLNVFKCDYSYIDRKDFKKLFKKSTWFELPVGENGRCGVIRFSLYDLY